MRRVAREGCKRLQEEFEVGDFKDHKGLWNIAQRRMLEDRATLHQEDFFSSWFREDVEAEAEEMEKKNREVKEEKCKRGKRECKGEKERVAVVCKRAC